VSKVGFAAGYRPRVILIDIIDAQQFKEICVRFIFTMFFMLFLASGLASASSETPEEFFKRFVELGHRFDPAVADMYADSASIKMYRRYPHGLERTMDTSGAEWKALVRRVMPLGRP